jgi:hypothetical protein
MNWYATRHDDYHPPIVRGMRRQIRKEHTRARILSDEEICTIWKQAEANGTFGAIIRLAFDGATKPQGFNDEMVGCGRSTANG